MCSTTNCAICFESVHNGHYPISQRFFKQLKLTGKYKKSKNTWPEKLKCGHVFHLKCIKDWFMGQRDRSENCPMCREKIKFSNKFGITNKRIYTEKTKKYESEISNLEDDFSDDSSDYDDMPPLVDGAAEQIYNSLDSISTNHQFEEIIGGNNTSVLSIINSLLEHHPWNTFSRNDLIEILGNSIQNIPQIFYRLYDQFDTTNELIHTPFRDSLVNYLMDRYDEDMTLNFSETTTLHMIAHILDNRSRVQIPSENTQTEYSNSTNELSITNSINNQLYTEEEIWNLEPRRLNFDNLSVVGVGDYHLPHEMEIKVQTFKKNQQKIKKFSHNKRYFAKMNVHTHKKWKRY